MTGGGVIPGPLGRRLLALMALVALLTAGLAQQVASVRCAMTGALHWVACCQVAARDDDAPALDDPACCEHQERDAPVASAPAPALDLADALAPPPATPWPAAPALAPRPRRADLGLGSRAPPARAGPRAPPTIARRLAALSVLRS